MPRLKKIRRDFPQSLTHPPTDEGEERLPRWDQERRTLWLGSQLIKQFKQPAPIQELILAAFQEEGWPPHLDDPLPPERDQDAKERLHHTIKNLNRALKCGLLHFHGDGNGRGITWKLILEKQW